MKRKAVFLIIFVILVLVVLGIIAVIRGRTPKQGELKVESQPTASVFLDNKHIGRTPIGRTSFKVDAGEYVVKIAPESTTTQYASWQGKVNIHPNLLTYINATLSESELSSAIDVLWLEKAVGKKTEIAVTTTPDSATVMLDDETKGMTPLSIADVTAGDHTLTVTSPGFLPRSIKIRITPGYRLIASVKLALSAGGQPEETATPSVSPSPQPTGKQSSPTPTGSPKPTPTQATGTTPTKPYAVVKETPTGFLRVRMEPTTTASEVARLKPGETYHITDEKSGWYEIQYDSLTTGWISGQYAEKVE